MADAELIVITCSRPPESECLPITGLMNKLHINLPSTQGLHLGRSRTGLHAISFHAPFTRQQAFALAAQEHLEQE